MAEADDLIRLTAEIVSAHAEGNMVASSDLPALIKSVHDALAGLGHEDVAGPEVPVPMREAAAVSVRKSLASPDKIISMIDGKPYSTLKRHIGQHGFTPETYRQRFGLKADYPMVAPAYSEMRKGMAKMIGLGRRAVGAAAASAAGVASAAVVALADALMPASEPAKPARKPRAAKAAPSPAQEPIVPAETAPATPKRGRKSKAAAAEPAPSIDAEEAPPAPKRRGRPPKLKAEAGSVQPAGEAPVSQSEPAPDDEFFDSAKGR